MNSSSEIRSWVSQLIHTFGEPRQLVEVAPLRELHESRRHSELVGLMARQFKLEVTFMVGYVRSGGPEGAPAWIESERMHGTSATFGTPAFKASVVRLYLRRAFLETATFAPVVMGIAHELSHVLLNSTHHPLRKEEKVVDLTAMLLGYRGIWQRDHDEVNWVETGSCQRFAAPVRRSYGYLNNAEVSYAKMLMQG